MDRYNCIHLYRTLVYDQQKPNMPYRLSTLIAHGKNAMIVNPAELQQMKQADEKYFQLHKSIREEDDSYKFERLFVQLQSNPHYTVSTLLRGIQQLWNIQPDKCKVTVPIFRFHFPFALEKVIMF